MNFSNTVVRVIKEITSSSDAIIRVEIWKPGRDLPCEWLVERAQITSSCRNAPSSSGVPALRMAALVINAAQEVGKEEKFSQINITKSALTIVP